MFDFLINKSNSSSDIKNYHLSSINSPKKEKNYIKIKLPKLKRDNHLKQKNKIDNLRKEFIINIKNIQNPNISNNNSGDNISTIENNKKNNIVLTPNNKYIRNKSISNNIKERNLLSNKSIKKSKSNNLFMNNIDKFIIPNNISNNENKKNFFQRNYSTKNVINNNSNIEFNNINLSLSPKPHSPKIKKNINFLFNFPRNKIKFPKNFHQKLMIKNIDTYNLSKLNDYKNIIKEENKKIEEKLNEKITTGIYGPNNNLLSIILARMERLKINHEFKERVSDPEIQKVLQDEFMLAQVRLKRKPKKIIIEKNNEIKSLCMKKMEKYNYLSTQNKIMNVNPIGNLPKMIEDNEIMYEYYNDAFKFFKDKKV